MIKEQVLDGTNLNVISIRLMKENSIKIDGLLLNFGDLVFLLCFDSFVQNGW